MSSQTGNGSKIASIPVVYSRQNNSRRVGNRFFHFHPNYAKEIIKFQQPYVSKKIVHLPKLLSPPPPDLYALVHVRKSGMSSEKGTFEQALRTNKTLSYFPTVQKKKQLLLTYQPDLKISNVQPATSAIGIGSVWNNRGIADAILDVKCNLMVIFSPMAGVQLITDLMKHYLETDRFRQVDVRDYQNSRIKKIKLVRDPFNRAVGNYLRYIWEANSDDSFEMYLDSLLNNTRDNIQPIATIKNRNYQARIQTSDLDKYIHYFIKIEEIETGLIELDQRILSTFYHSYQAVKQTIINPYMIDLPADIFQVVENSENDKYVGNQSANYFRTLDDKFEIPPYHFFYNSLTRKKVEQIYNKDLNTYNYTRGGGAPLPL